MGRILRGTLGYQAIQEAFRVMQPITELIEVESFTLPPQFSLLVVTPVLEGRYGHVVPWFKSCLECSAYTPPSSGSAPIVLPLFPSASTPYSLIFPPRLPLLQTASLAKPLRSHCKASVEHSVASI